MVSESPLIESEISQILRATVDVGPNTGPLAGPLSGAKLHLGASDLAIAPGTPYATLSGQEATYDGYAAQTLVWGDPVTSADGTVEVVAATLTFAPTGDTVEDSVYNFWVSNTAGSAWYFAGSIVDGPLPMASDLDQAKITIRYRPASQTLAVTIA